MNYIVNLYSTKDNEIKNFLNTFYQKEVNIRNNLKWKKFFKNPIDMLNIITAIIDNNDKYNINIWISLDKGFFINVTSANLNEIIKYIYERFPY